MDLLADLNEPQREAVMHMDGPLLVLAGAGSGKTRVITRRVAHLVQQGVPPWQVLALTFTNKAAGEMRERVEALGVPRGTTVVTFHSLCARLLREFGAEAGMTGNFSIYDRDDQIKVVKQALETLDYPKENFQPARVLAIISGAKNQLRTPEQFAQKTEDFFGRKVAAVYREYEKVLKAGNAMDFDDLLVKMAYLMRDRSDIRELLARRYRYILIDEYQDTNHAQYVLAHGIAMEHENICATGDPDQSIYAWRGADIHNILDFEKDYPNAKVVLLEENYRSTGPILAAASRLIANNTQRKDKILWTRRPGGSDIRVIFCENEHAEAAEIARRIAEYRQAGGAYSDVAVFYRMNSLSRVLEEALLRAGIPYAIARGVEFYNRKEIKDVLAYLRVLINPADDLSCERIINVPARGIGATTVNRLRAYATLRSCNLLEAARAAEMAGLSPAAAKKARDFGDMIGAMAATLAGNVRDIVEDIIRRSGLEEMYAGTDEDNRQARANVAELVSAAEEFGRTNPEGNLTDFLQQVSLVSDADHMEGSGGSVVLMTMHAAKGLEFPAVFIAGCETGVLPMMRMDTSGRPDPNDMEEERRLAFVGMTRAMNELTMTVARMRMIRGQTIHQEMSPFIREIGRQNVTHLEAAGVPQQRRALKGAHGGFYADIAAREAIERQIAAGDGPIPGEDLFREAEDFPLPTEYEYLRVGSKVRHQQFGDGKVVSISQPWPETRAKVAFGEWGVKTLVLSKTKLEVLG